jgi:hypothetical protein
MRTIMEDAVWSDGPEAWQAPRSLLDQIGWKGLLAVGWRSTPLLLRPIALPYTLIAYRRLLAASDCPERLLTLHSRQYQASLLFRTLRPRFRKTHALLRSFEANCPRTMTPPEPQQDQASLAQLRFA